MLRTIVSFRRIVFEFSDIIYSRSTRVCQDVSEGSRNEVPSIISTAIHVQSNFPKNATEYVMQFLRDDQHNRRHYSYIIYSADIDGEKGSGERGRRGVGGEGKGSGVRIYQIRASSVHAGVPRE